MAMPLEYGDEIWRQKTEMTYGEEKNHDRRLNHVCTVHEFDRQTDGQIYDDWDRAMHRVAR